MNKTCEAKLKYRTFTSASMSFIHLQSHLAILAFFSVTERQLSSSVCTEEDTAGTWCFSVISLGTVTLQADTLPEGCFRAASCSFVVN